MFFASLVEQQYHNLDCATVKKLKKIYFIIISLSVARMVTPKNHIFCAACTVFIPARQSMTDTMYTNIA